MRYTLRRERWELKEKKKREEEARQANAPNQEKKRAEK